MRQAYKTLWRMAGVSITEDLMQKVWIIHKRP